MLILLRRRLARHPLSPFDLAKQLSLCDSPRRFWDSKEALAIFFHLIGALSKDKPLRLLVNRCIFAHLPLFVIILTDWSSHVVWWRYSTLFARLFTLKMRQVVLKSGNWCRSHLLALERLSFMAHDRSSLVVQICLGWRAPDILTASLVF